MMYAMPNAATLSMQASNSSSASASAVSSSSSAAAIVKQVRQAQIEILELRDDFIKFVLSNTEVSVANALRRAMIADVRTMAIDLVKIRENTSPLSDEFIAHRLGMIPLRVPAGNPKDVFHPTKDCVCGSSDFCPNCSATFTLEVENPIDSGILAMNVYSTHLIPYDRYRCEAVHYSSLDDMEVESDHSRNGILLLKLGPGQKISLRATATLGFGKIHAKWSPVCVATFARDPIVTLNIARLDEINDYQRIEFANSCPAGVFHYDDRAKKVTVSNMDACMFCDECVKVGRSFRAKNDDDNIVTIQSKPFRFIFSVETNGSLMPEQVVLQGIDSLRQMLVEINNKVPSPADVKEDDIKSTTDAQYRQKLGRYAFVDTGGFI